MCPARRSCSSGVWIGKDRFGQRFVSRETSLKLSAGQAFAWYLYSLSVSSFARVPGAGSVDLEENDEIADADCLRHIFWIYMENNWH